MRGTSGEMRFTLPNRKLVCGASKDEGEPENREIKPSMPPIQSSIHPSVVHPPFIYPSTTFGGPPPFRVG